MRLPHPASAVLFLALLLLGCGTKPAPDAAPAPEPTPAAPQAAAAAGIEGTYLVVRVEMMGEKLPDESIAKDSELDRTVKISKDRIQFKFFKRETVRYTLDPSKSPAEIDVFTDEPGKKAKASYGIYKVEGKTLTLFLMGSEEPELRPREFKTLAPPKDGKFDPNAGKQAGGILMLTLKKVSDDTTFVTDVPPPPKPPAVDDGAVVAELTKKGFVAETGGYGKYPGVNVTVPAGVSPAALKELNGHPRIRSVAFKTRVLDGPHKVTDEAVRSLTKLDGLVALEFESCRNLTAGAFRDLSRFPMLTIVSASDMPLDDDAVEEIAKLKGLEQVSLSSAKLTDTSLAALAKARTLKGVRLSGEAVVTAAGVKRLSALPDLELLWLQNIPVADAALGELNLPKLKNLNLARSDISDEGLGKLPVLPELRDVTLSGLKLTDAGVMHLTRQPRLESVSLFDTRVTKAGVAELKKLKPKLLISGEN